MKVALKYKISVYGTYHKGINFCPHCNYQPDNVKEGFFNQVCGFCETEIGLLMVVECPKCFEKYSFHSDEDFYMYFLCSIDEGTNKHFTNK